MHVPTQPVHAGSLTHRTDIAGSDVDLVIEIYGADSLSKSVRRLLYKAIRVRFQNLGAWFPLR